MVDQAAYIALVAQCLSDDSALNALVDGQIIPGFRRAAADQFLAGSHRACVGVRALSLLSEGLPGCAYHGISDHDLLVEFDIWQISQDDAEVSAIAHEIQRIMKAPLEKTIGGVSYSASTNGSIKFRMVENEQLSDRFEMTGTCRLRFLDD